MMDRGTTSTADTTHAEPSAATTPGCHVGPCAPASANLFTVAAATNQNDDAPSDPGRWVPWLLRVVWILVAVLGWPAVAGAVDDRSDAVRVVATAGAATVWVLGVAAMAVPAVSSLTAVRAVVPIAAVGGIASLLAGAPAVDGITLVALGATATIVAGSAELGRAFVQASAYGDEQRYPLRPPLGFAVATGLSWVLWVVALVAGPLLLAAKSWIAGGVVTALAVAGTVLLPPRWHRLSRRWFVIVPAGLVLHDHVVLAETLMLQRSQVAGVRLAPAGTDALDLTGPAAGNAIEVTSSDAVTALLAPTPAEPRGRTVHVTAFLVAPSRPGRALAATARRRMHIG
jgi:hypothetical protein